MTADEAQFQTIMVMGLHFVLDAMLEGREILESNRKQVRELQIAMQLHLKETTDALRKEMGEKS